MTVPTGMLAVSADCNAVTVVCKLLMAVTKVPRYAVISLALIGLPLIIKVGDETDCAFIPETKPIANIKTTNDRFIVYSKKS